MVASDSSTSSFIVFKIVAFVNLSFFIIHHLSFIIHHFVSYMKGMKLINKKIAS